MQNKKKCPQCKNLIYVTAPTCLHCGRPNKFVTKDYVNAKWQRKEDRNLYFTYRKFKILVIILLFIIFLQVLIMLIL